MQKGCPFHSQTGGIALAEISGIVRCGDRLQLGRALDQFEQGLYRTEDLDEARGVALTFIAMVTAATLEMGGSRTMHRVQLEAARELDKVESPSLMSEICRRYVEHVVSPLFDPSLNPTQLLIDRALEYLNRNFYRELTDDIVARELGLSTSHFRHLFREATGQPFRRYLMALRLERARSMIIEGDQAISEIAIEVGFTGLAHFSRAFTQRFAASPTSLRRGGMAVAAQQ